MMSFLLCRQFLNKGSNIVFFPIIASIILVGMVMLSPHKLIYDEPLHLEGAILLSKGMPINQLLIEPLPSAPGPLYPILHSILYPITQFRPLFVRFVDIALLLINIISLAFCLKFFQIKNPWFYSTSMLAIPMVWVTSGMALTEIPALTMATLSLAISAYAIKEKNSSRLICYLTFIISGLFAGAAILGRQTYLPALSLFLLLSLCNRYYRWPAFSAFSAACISIMPVFAIWGGIVPKSQVNVGEGFVFNHGLLAYAYLTCIIIILAPSFFKPKWQWIVCAFCIAFITNTTIVHLKHEAFKGLTKYLIWITEEQYSLIVGSLLFGIAFSFFTALIFNLLKKRTDFIFICSSGVTCLLVATSFGITHLFSSRYLMTSFPFVILMLYPFYRPSWFSIFRLCTGAIIGAVSLGSYFQFW